MKATREELIKFNNELARYQDRLPKEIIIDWNELFQNLINSEAGNETPTVMPRFLTILIMATIQAIVTICVRNLESYISFPIAYIVGWGMCIIWNKLYS